MEHIAIDVHDEVALTPPRASASEWSAANCREADNARPGLRYDRSYQKKGEMLVAVCSPP